MATMHTVIQKMIALGAYFPDQPSRPAQSSIFKFGFIASQADAGQVMVNIDDGMVNAIPVTDETLSAGQKVCLIKADTGTYILLGSARQ